MSEVTDKPGSSKAASARPVGATVRVSRTALPIDLGREGDVTVLIVFGTGFRDAIEVVARANGQEVQVLFSGGQPEFRGLDQANLLLDRNLAGSGEVEIIFLADGVEANVVTIAIQ